jgi:hypothetical protein
MIVVRAYDLAKLLKRCNRGVPGVPMINSGVAKSGPGVIIDRDVQISTLHIHIPLFNGAVLPVPMDLICQDCMLCANTVPKDDAAL